MDSHCHDLYCKKVNKEMDVEEGPESRLDRAWLARQFPLSIKQQPNL